MSVSFKDTLNGVTPSSETTLRFKQSLYLNGELVGERTLADASSVYVRIYDETPEEDIVDFSNNRFISVPYQNNLHNRDFTIVAWFRPSEYRTYWTGGAFNVGTNVQESWDGSGIILSLQDVSGRHIYGLEYDALNHNIVYHGGSWEIAAPQEIKVSDRISKSEMEGAISKFDNDDYVVVWVSENAGSKTGKDIFAKRYASNGDQITKPSYPGDTTDSGMRDEATSVIYQYDVSATLYKKRPHNLLPLYRCLTEAIFWMFLIHLS